MATTQHHHGAPRQIGRRTALRRLGGIAVALCTGGCSRGLVLRAIYPESVELPDERITSLLAAFVDTVVPGVDRPDRVVELMRDPGLPFAAYCRVLAADLTRRAGTRAGRVAFDRLPLAARTAVVREALESGGIPSRVYNGAVLFAQATVYAGLTSDDGSCAITGFEGPFRFRGLAAQTYPDPEHFLPTPLSADGNPW